MARQIYFPIVLCVVIAGLTSCSRKCTCVVDPGGLEPSLVSFSVVEIDTFVLKKFAKGSNFTTFLDSTLIDTIHFMYTPHHDTTDVFTGSSNASLFSKYDYEFFFPSLGVLFKISDIDEPQVEGDCPHKIQCVDPINSYKINGVLTMKINPYDNRIYIQK